MPKKRTDLDIAIDSALWDTMANNKNGHKEAARQSKQLAGWLKELKAKRKEVKAYQANIRKAANALLTCNTELVRLEHSIVRLQSNTRGWGTLSSLDNAPAFGHPDL